MSLDPQQFEYTNLRKRLQPYIDNGLAESAAFMAWFFENYYRMEDVAARDSICDKPNDKGVDGIYVDDNLGEIHVVQAKLRQKDRARGEADLKDLVATLTQFGSSEAVEELQKGTASPELKRLLRDQDVVSKLKAGYEVSGVFVTNVSLDVNAREFLKHNDELAVFGKDRLAKEFVDPNLPEGVAGKFTFTTDHGFLDYSAGTSAKMYMMLAKGSELVKLNGLADQSLFSLNVRLSLGNTSVNKGIVESVLNKKQHIRFPLFHNGVTLLAKNVAIDDSLERITVSDYVVVNGAQSLTALYHNSEKITDDLSMLLRIVEVGTDHDLARQITSISNNQNAIKPRDLRSNNAIQTRLKGEFDDKYSGKYYFVIKQGEPKRQGVRIENDEAGRLLLSFDLKEPWNAHQIYRVFDDDYARIFGRPSVDAGRVVFLHELSCLVVDALAEMDDRKVATYRLTRYFLMYCLREILDGSDFGRRLLLEPTKFVGKKKWSEIADWISQVLLGLVTDFEDDIEESADDFDYKAELKSPVRVPIIARGLIKSFQRDLRRDKIDDPDELFG
jgi:hypothetical protein